MANGPTRASGYTSYASDSTSKFINQVWSKKMLRNFYETTAFMEIANTDYEGEIKSQGDKVIIRTIPTIDINDYEVGGTLTYQVPALANKELNIDKAKSWSFRLDDVDAVQTDLPLMNKFAADAGERLKIKIDQQCFELSVGDAAATNKGTYAGALSGDQATVGINMGTTAAPLSVTKTNATDIIVDANTVLDEANIPSENRWIVLPAWFCALLKKSDLKAANITGDSSGVLRTGVVGMIDRTKVIQSNNLYNPTGEVYFHCFAGTKEAMTFALQLTKTESLRIPDSFGDYMRGLSVYGFETLQDTALVELVAQRG